MQARWLRYLDKLGGIGMRGEKLTRQDFPRSDANVSFTALAGEGPLFIEVCGFDQGLVPDEALKLRDWLTKNFDKGNKSQSVPDQIKFVDEAVDLSRSGAIGVMPRKLWDEERACDLMRAIEDCLKAGKPIDPRWTNELCDIQRLHNDRLEGIG